MAEAPKFNLRNPAVKRIMQEIKEIKEDTSGDFLAEALETDIFEWHFVIRGPQDTEFDGGIFHGRILLPAEYPFKPPSFMMLTPNGRFETNVKICLSISSHHPEHWQPSWSVRTALTALIAFMPSPGAGALGALDFTKEERRVLAARSRLEAPRFGSAERQRVIDEMHGRMLAIATAKEAERQARGDAAAGQTESRFSLENRSELEVASSTTSAEPAAAATAGPGKSEAVGASGAFQAGAGDRAGGPGSSSAPQPAAASEQQAQGASVAAEAPPSRVAVGAPSATPSTASLSAVPQPQAAMEKAPLQQPGCSATTSTTASVTVASLPHAPSAQAASQPSAAAPLPAAAPARWAAAANPAAMAAAAPATAGAAATSTDHMLTALMWALYVGIGAILLRKVMGVMGVDLAELLH